ncbi:ATP-grasp domain-containing protein [Methanobrevibacter filiformis]|uniref:Carbamoyl phosphate synthase-like protein n=1 Tax=Methanobrevibacter filiformis TaxID=55758 RepID=A0A166CWH6_9EURY|nr:ATP-grasp domain-containing protein [Methanobrevibacter filiformis]KZX14936.1 carbamoyl phosphate synthase-like protein [Methanobrevibacter filiformis]
MEKLLILGINTRPLVNSALKLKYQTYSCSYFSTLDFKEPYKEKHILNQKPNKTCGHFEENYHPSEILELGIEYMGEVDHIILHSGISPNDFNDNNKVKKYKSKIIGNKNTENVEDKYKFYKKIKNKFPTPLTFKFENYDKNDMLTVVEVVDEVIEILQQHDDKTFMIKPLQGSGGYGVKLLNTESNIPFNERNHDYENKFLELIKTNTPFILQEYIEGKNISSSLLSTKKRSKSIIISDNLNNSNIEHDSYLNDFRYSGNITPSENSYDIKEIESVCEDIISYFKLIGSNGVDMIIDKNGELHIIEINPRFQGTYECVESTLGINLLDAHIQACNGNLIETPSPQRPCIKKIIYSKKRVKFNNKDFTLGDNIKNSYVCDIPHENVIIEKDQPLLTIISSEKTLGRSKLAIDIITKNVEKIY